MLCYKNKINGDCSFCVLCPYHTERPSVQPEKVELSLYLLEISSKVSFKLFLKTIFLKIFFMLFSQMALILLFSPYSITFLLC